MDVSTFPDLDVTGNELTEDASIIECLRRGLSQPAGSLSYSPEDGFDLRAILSRAVDLRRTFVIEDAVQAQALRDERVAKASVSVSYDVSTEAVRGTILLTKRDGRDLRLTVAADRLSVSLLRS